MGRVRHPLFDFCFDLVISDSAFPWLSYAVLAPLAGHKITGLFFVLKLIVFWSVSRPLSCRPSGVVVSSVGWRSPGHIVRLFLPAQQSCPLGLGLSPELMHDDLGFVISSPSFF